MNVVLFMLCCLILSVSCVALCAIQLFVYHRERKDLYDRIMGGSEAGYLRIKDSKSSNSREKTVNVHKRAVEDFHKKGLGADIE